MEISYSENHIEFSSKPTPENYVSIQFNGVSKGIEDLITHIESGKSFTGGIFNNNRRDTDFFISQQIIALDFDNTISLLEAQMMLTQYDLAYNFGYYTFSHTNGAPRFRLVFILDGEIRDAELVKRICEAFHVFFNRTTDKACIDVSRIWLGSKSRSFAGLLQQRLNLLELLDKINLKIYSGDRNRSRYCIEARDIDVIEDRTNPGFPIRIYNRVNQFCTDDTDDEEFIQSEIDNWEIEDLLQYNIFKLFYDGKASGKPNKLSHLELFGIATNLAPLKTGRKLFKELLNKNKHYSRDKYSIMSYVIYKQYKPMEINKFSPYQIDKENSLQTFPQAVKKRGQIIVTNEPKLIELEDAEKMLDEQFKKALSAKNNNIYLFKCAAGLGKTRLVKNEKNIVVAFPNHQLKDEHYQSSALISGKEKLITPEIDGIFTKPVADRIERLYEMDLTKDVMVVIKTLAAGYSIFQNKIVDSKDVNAANKFLDHLLEVENAGASKTIFTTHSKAILSDFAHDTIIYDEDPISVILEQHKALKHELISLAGLLNIKGQNCKPFYEILNQPDFDLPKKTPSLNINGRLVYETCADAKFNSHVINFFNSDFYFINNLYINYFINNTRRFRLDKKYIICDATASVELYKKLFGDRLVVIDISNVRNLGKIEQYTKFSCSRTALPKYIQSISKRFDPLLPTISFKDFKSMFNNPTKDMHFGKVRGSNILSGKNINVIGTQHYNPVYYKFISSMLKLDVTDFTMKTMSVSYNGRNFKFTTFSDPDLQSIHLQTVEGELIQAVQRPRLIRNDATVYLYSNFPLQQANYFY